MDKNDEGKPLDRSELAENRTEFAEDRTIMSVERTFAGWMRTSFAAIGIGIAFHALFGDLQPPWLARAIATLFIVLGAIIAIGAERRACGNFDRLSTHHIDSPKIPNLRWIAYAVVVGAAALAVSLWLMREPL